MKAKLQIGMLALALAGSSFLAGCSSKITKEQLDEMRRLRAQEQTLKNEISAKTSERDRLQREVDARRREVDNCNSRRQFVQSKLAQWPNVWPAGLFPEN
jgi:outer membrane murein-binding lipoprotein Lpp